MANKDLINLGISPDSGTGDSARRGGEKVNNLFADVYSQFGDNPVGQDPSGPFYGYRRPFFEYEYKVGELHPAGRFIPIEFKSTNSRQRIYDQLWGYGHDSTGNLIDSDGDGIPNIYRDSEWYFLSRGEQIDADFTNVDSDTDIHFVLPIGVPGDQIIIRDGFGTWNNTINDKGIHVNFWTTPFEFQTVEQVTEWERNTGVPGTDLDSDVVSIRDPLSGAFYASNWHKVKAPDAISNVYPRLDQPFATSRSTDPYDGRSRTYVVNKRRYQFELLFTNYNEGWIIRQVALDAADVGATLLQFGNRLDAVDSDLDKGLYVSADSDIRHTVPIFRRTNDGREIHGTLALRGDNDAIMTTIDSEDTAMINDPRAANGGDTVQPLTTTIRFKLRDNVKVKDNLFVGNDLEVGRHLQVGETLTIDSDLAYFNNRLQVHEKATFDSDVLISGELDVTQQARFASSVRIDGNLIVAGDATVIETETLRVSDNLITLSKDADGAPITDTGLLFQRYDRTNGVNGVLTASDTVYNTAFYWNEANDRFVFGETVSSDSEQTITLEKTYATVARDYSFFNTDVEIGGHLQVGETLTIDSDLAYFNNNVQIHETLRVDSDVSILGQMTVAESSTFNSDVKFKQNIFVEGAAYFQASARFADNLIPLSSNNDGAPIVDTGFIFQRYDRTNGVNTPLIASDTVYNPFMIWNEQTDTFRFGETVSSDSEQNLTAARTYATLGRGLFTLNDSENAPRVIFEKAGPGNFPDAVRGPGAALLNPNERPTVEPDYAFHVKANAVFGRDSDDVVVFNSRVMSNFVPFGDEVYSLGDSDNKWKDLYLAGNTIHLGSIKIKERNGAIFITDSDDRRIDLDGAAFRSDSAIVDSDLSVGGNTQFAGRLGVGEHAVFDSDVFVAGNVVVVQNMGVQGELRVQANARFDSDVYIGGNLTVEEDVDLQGDVIIGQSLTVDSDVILSADLRVDSDVIIKGTMSVGQEVYFYDDVFFYDNAYFDSDVLIRGSLTVNGTTTYVNSTNLEIKDNFIVINKNQASPFNDTGIIFQRFDSDSVSGTNFNGVLEWDELGDKFILGETGGSGILPNPGITASYAQFYSNGDVQFFENTGTTAKFHWDGADERLGLGTVNPTTKFEIDNGTDDKYIQIIKGSNDKYIAFGVENDTAYVTAGTAGAASSRELAFQVAPASGVEYEVGRFNSAGSWLIGGDTVASAKFAFDMSGNSDPGGAPAGWAGGARPTLTGDGVIDGGTF